MQVIIRKKKSFLELSNLFNFNFINLIIMIFSLNDAYKFNQWCKRNFKNKIT